MDKERLYDAFGELAYAIAKADGLIDGDEINKLTEIMDKHPWASNIKWSFNYEWLKDESSEEIYKKALTRCLQYGPTPEFKEMIDLMNKIAAASNGIDPSEKKIIDSFASDLIKDFQNKIEKLPIND